jgi:hypothetical protein
MTIDPFSSRTDKNSYQKWKILLTFIYPKKAFLETCSSCFRGKKICCCFEVIGL